jgi:hypothetical protein
MDDRKTNRSRGPLRKGQLAKGEAYYFTRKLATPVRERKALAAKPLPAGSNDDSPKEKARKNKAG